MSTAIRPPAVAGQFYPADSRELRSDVEAFARSSIEPTEAKIRALGCVVPHAGYVYSGSVAGAVYRRLELPKRYIVLCPNHTGRGEPLAIMSVGAWRTPLGDAPLDEALASSLKARFPLLTEDEAAHRFEHALEVQLPFLQVLSPKLPVCSHRCRYGSLPGVKRSGGRDRFRDCRSRRARSGDCLQRHEPLRKRFRDTRERPARHRPDSGSRSTRPLRRSARSEHQHVRLWADRRNAHRRPETRRNQS